MHSPLRTPSNSKESNQPLHSRVATHTRRIRSLGTLAACTTNTCSALTASAGCLTTSSLSFNPAVRMRLPASKGSTAWSRRFTPRWESSQQDRQRDKQREPRSKRIVAGGCITVLVKHGTPRVFFESTSTSQPALEKVTFGPHFSNSPLPFGSRDRLSYHVLRFHV